AGESFEVRTPLVIEEATTDDGRPLRLLIRTHVEHFEGLTAVEERLELRGREDPRDRRCIGIFDVKPRAQRGLPPIDRHAITSTRRRAIDEQHDTVVLEHEVVILRVVEAKPRTKL